MQTKNINLDVPDVSNNNNFNNSECVRRIILELESQHESEWTPLQLPIIHSDSAELESSGPYKRVPLPKPVTTESQDPPPYRMPPRPLHNEPAIPGAPDQPHTSAPNLHTHSSKFPIEREVTLSSTDKNSKIPILNEYLKRPNASIAPDAPHIQMAWIEDKNRNSSLNHAMSSQQAPNLQVFKAQPMTLMDASQLSELSPIRSQDQSNGPPNLSQMSMGAVPKNAHSTPEMENSASKASRTYHTIKDMIQSRFSKNKTEPCTETELNNAENNGSNGITPLSVKPEDSLSPQSQLRQHGVYIGAVSQSPQQQIRTMQQSQVISRNNEIMRRNQEIRDRHLQQQQQPHQQYQPQQHQQQYQQQQPPQQQQQQQHQLYQTPQHYQQLQSQQQYQHPPQHLHHQHQQHQQHTPQQHQLNQLHVQQHQQHLLNQQVYQQSPREKIPDRVMDPPQVEPTQRNHLITESNQKTIYLDSRGLSVHTPNPRQLVNDNETPVSRRMEGVYGQRNIITDTRMAKSQIDLVSSCNNLENQTTPASNLRYSNNNIPADVLRSGQVFSRTPMTPISPYQSKDIKRMDNQRTASDQKIQPPSQPTPNPKPAYLNPRPVEEYSNRIPEMIHYNDQQPMPHPSAYHKVNKEDIAREPVMRNEAEQPSRKDTFQASNQPCESPRENFNSAALSGEDEGGFGKNGGPFSGTSSDYDKMRNGGHSDSGRGSTVYSSGKAGKSERNIDTSPELGSEPHRNTGANENGWVDVVENELRNILDPKLQVNAADSTISESISSLTPPLPPLSPTGSSDEHQQVQYKHKSLPYGNKSEYPPKNSKYVTTQAPCKGMWSARVNAKDKSSHHRLTSSKRNETQKLPPLLLSSHLDIDSMLDNDNSSDEESTTIDTHHAQTIRKQLEALETMYSEVLKLLGVRKNTSHHYQPSDPRVHRRRLHGSMSSLPSSVSSRPVRDKHRRTDERKKVKDIRGINKRFQRLESHVVTLARSVAHLSSEMRTQHIMIQEMEVIRGELAALRTQTNMLTVRSHSVPCAVPAQNTAAAEQVNSSPGKMKKLTKFFGEEPPLMKLFLEKLGYEKYAKLFDKERIGFVELPYLTEERLHKLGIPLGPRLRIMQEAQMGFPTFENTLCVI